MANSSIRRVNKRTRTERRLRVRALILGSLLTILVIILFLAGDLDWLEGRLYDARAQWCQFFRKPPTDRLVHVDIDDAAREILGRWPWHRNVLADVVDELGRSGVKAIALDIVLAEPQEAKIDKAGAVTDYDALLTAAVKRVGHVLIPASMMFQPPEVDPPIVASAIAELSGNLELTYDQLNLKLAAAGKAAASEDEYVQALREAMDGRIRRESSGDTVFEQLRAKVLPQWSRLQFDENAPEVRTFRRQYDLIQAERSYERFMLPMPGSISALHVYSMIAPLPMYSAAAQYGGLVDHIPEKDGKIRRVPLVAEFQGRLIPQMALVLACAALDVEPGSMEITDDRIIIPTPDGFNITIPVSSRKTPQGTRGMFMDIPWFGNGNWRTMYPGRLGQHLNIGWLYELANWRKKLRSNNALIDDAIKDVLRIENDWGPPDRYEKLKLGADDFSARLGYVQQILSKDMVSMVESIRATPIDQRDQYTNVPKSFDAVNIALEQNKQLLEQINDRAGQLHQMLDGRVVLIGDTGSSSTDLINTPLAPQVPGVVAHGTIVNAILTRQLWQEAPVWITVLYTLAAGLFATMSVAFLKHWQAAIAVVFLLVGYFALDWIVLFAQGNYLVGTAGPLTAVVLVWAAVTFITLVIQSSEHTRIRHHFSTYVDPQLADFYLENPEQLHIRGQMKELTVVFTDLVGFTAITEKVGERTVEILNEYLSIMVPIIRSRRGLLNKFLGDGIMIIFGALWENPDHASNAVDTALEMLKATNEFGKVLESRGLPPVKMRAGISTGLMVVGDAGSKTARDYTVLGDAVNTGARLEQANKRLDTHILVSGGTFRHLDSRFLLRPVGNLMLAGKTEAVEAYEVLARREDATAADLRLVELSGMIVTHVNAGKINDCREPIQAIMTEFGPSKFTHIYEQLRLDDKGDGKTPQKHISA